MSVRLRAVRHPLEAPIPHASKLCPFDASRGNRKTNFWFSQCARRSRKCEYPTMPRRGLLKRRDNGGDHAPYIKEDQEQLHVETSLLAPLSISGPHSDSSGGHIPTPLSSSFSSSDIGTPISSVNLMDNAASSSSLSTPTLVPNPKVGQSVLKLPTTKQSTQRKPAIACLFCREHKIACGAPPVGRADTTCKYVVPI